MSAINCWTWRGTRCRQISKELLKKNLFMNPSIIQVKKILKGFICNLFNVLDREQPAESELEENTWRHLEFRFSKFRNQQFNIRFFQINKEFKIKLGCQNTHQERLGEQNFSMLQLNPVTSRVQMSNQAENNTRGKIVGIFTTLENTQFSGLILITRLKTLVVDNTFWHKICSKSAQQQVYDKNKSTDMLEKVVNKPNKIPILCRWQI